MYSSYEQKSLERRWEKGTARQKRLSGTSRAFPLAQLPVLAELEAEQDRDESTKTWGNNRPRWGEYVGPQE